MLSFRRYDDIGDHRWDALVHASPEGWAWSTSHWRRVILNVAEWGLTDFSFGAFDGDRLVAVMPLQYQAASRRMASTGWSAGGVAVAAEIPGAERQAITGAAIAHARELADDQGASTLEVTLSPLRAASLQAPHQNPMTAFGFEDLSTQTLVADLAQPEEALWMALSKDARQAIKKAERAGYRAIGGGWTTHADAYYPVHVETYTRTGVPPHPRTYFEGFATEMAPAGLSELWVGLAPDGRPVAFHNDTHFHHARVYHTGCSETAHLDSGVNYLLFWAAIKGARDAGCRWYEIGEVFPTATDGKTRGLTVFKSKFGGEHHHYFRARLPLTASAPRESSADAVIRDAYRDGAVYHPATICRTAQSDSPEYADRLLAERLNEVRRLGTTGVLIDLCCATGAHVIDLAQSASLAIGIDFSERYLANAAGDARQSSRRVAFVQGNARQLPVAPASVDTLYCFSALYAIPNAAEAVAEVGRVLRPGGHAVLDFGNRHSLNVFCLRYYPEWPPIQPLTLGEIRAAIRAAGLEIVRHRCFQLLPLWTNRPGWLWPLLHPFWTRLFKRYVAGRMLDEWVSSLPVLNRFAFRHVIVCRKPQA
jgi:SAM-dependent methyltransferase